MSDPVSDPNVPPDTGTGFDVGSFLKNVYGFLTSGGAGSGAVNPILLGLAGAQVLNASHLGAKADQYAQAASDQYGAQAPLRAAGTSGLLTPRPMQDVSALSSIRNQNPVAARSSPLQLPPSATPAVPAAVVPPAAQTNGGGVNAPVTRPRRAAFT